MVNVIYVLPGDADFLLDGIVFYTPNLNNIFEVYKRGTD